MPKKKPTKPATKLKPSMKALVKASAKSASKTPVKSATKSASKVVVRAAAKVTTKPKPTLKSAKAPKPEKKSLHKPTEKALSAKPTKLMAAKKAEVPKAKGPAPKQAEKLAKSEKAQKPEKQRDKLKGPAEKLAKGKMPVKDEKLRPKKTNEERELEEFEAELEHEAVSYGDAIKLTPQDLEDPEDFVLTDAEGRRYCKVKDCDQLAVVEGHCRFHYIALWKKIQIRKKILTDGKLEKYIEELTSRYPDKYIEMIRRDLKSEKDFLSAIQELEIDDSAEGEFEDDTAIDEVRGMGGAVKGPGESSGEEF